MKVFNTEADLALASLSIGQLVWTKGESAQNDGIAKLYQIFASGTGINLANGNVAVPYVLGGSGSGSGVRNLIANGDFRLWDRGTLFSPTGAPAQWIANRWYCPANVGASRSPVRPEFSDGNTGYVPDYSLSIAGDVGTNAEVYTTIPIGEIGQPQDFNEQLNFTLSFWVNTSDANDVDIETEIRFVDEVANNTNSVVVLPLTTVATPSDPFWFKLTQTFSIGANSPNFDNKALQVLLRDGSRTDGSNVRFALVQLEKGTDANEFESRDLETEKVIAGTINDLDLVKGQTNYTDEALRNRKNYLINGDMAINQRAGDPYTVANQYTLDRWIVGVNPGAAATNQLYDASVGFYLSTTRERVEQGVELAQAGAIQPFILNEQYTFSCLARGSGTLSLAVIFRDQTAGSGNQVTVLNRTDLGTLTGSFQRFTITFPMGSSPNPTNVCLSVIPGVTVGGNLDITQAQLEQSPVATDFEYRPIAEELALCQRYYWRLNLGSQNFTNSTALSTTLASAHIWFPTTMRANPNTITISGNLFSDTGGTLDDVVGVGTAFSFTEQSFRINIDNSVSGTYIVGYSYNLAFTPSGFLAADAEL